MNNFEKYDPTPPEPSSKEEGIHENPHDKESRLELFLGSALRCTKKWGASAVVGGLFVLALQKGAELKQNDQEYHDQVTAMLSAEDSKVLEKNNEEIRNLFGDEIVQSISFSDVRAFAERKIPRVEPTFVNFEGRGWDNFVTYGITEKHLIYPRGWVSGEVETVVYVEDGVKGEVGTHFKGVQAGGYIPERIFSGPTLVFYNTHEDAKSKLVPRSETVSHELAHANDWETDMDLSLIDRQELLLQVYKRMVSENAYEHEYHNAHRGTDNAGLYTAAKEYWAEICAEYFENPKKFLQDHPDDFALVDTYAKKNDSEFDVFHENRGAFDTNTGVLKDVWKNQAR